jgi:hypothetical protein
VVNVWYTFRDAEDDGSVHASRLILTVDKDHYSDVAFMENGKQAGAIAVPKDE